MPTVHRAHGLRFVVFTDDHEPAHVHAVGSGGEAKIDLGADSRLVRVVWTAGLSSAEVRRALAEAERERDRLLVAWTRIHGRSEP